MKPHLSCIDKSKACVLVVAAHPDDEVLGCGGAIARHAAEGDAVHILILGEGETSRTAQRDQIKSKDAIKRLRSNAKNAAKILGATSATTLAFPDNRFDSVPLLDIVKEVERVVSQYRPTIIYTHHAGDLNIDHRIAHNAVITACRPVIGQCVRTILAFEIASSTEWQVPGSERPFLPNHFVDIQRTLAKKIKAMSVYKSELRDYPHPRSLRAISLNAEKHGIDVGMGAVERFIVLRSIT